MPTYAYACSACEHAFDVRQSFSDAPLTTCPACARESLRKVFSPVGVVFKGSGFYRNDSRAAGRSKSGSGGASGADTSSSEKTSSEKTSSEKTSTGTATSNDAGASSGATSSGAGTSSASRSGSSGGAAAAS